jgi:chemotaxis protein CheD
MERKNVSKNLRPVPIGEMAVSADPEDVLVVFGLGSCVVICLYDPVVQVGGMLHALLPGRVNSRNGVGKPTKFVDCGVPLLIDSLAALGAKPIRLVVRLGGGARVTMAPGLDDSLNIGERNVLAAEVALENAGLEVQARAIGGPAGRTIKLYIDSGQATVKTLGQEEQLLI